jgi:rhamnose transport system permease protein
MIAAALPWLLLAIGVWLVASQVSRPAFLIKAGDVKARVGCIAMVMTAIVITGGIDLSVGSMLALATVVMASLWTAGVSPELAGCAALATGLAAGACNGGLVCLGLSPLVATLATMAFYRGLAVTLAGGRKITDFEVEPLLDPNFMGWPGEYWLLLLLFAIALVTVHFTRLGRWCFAIGDNSIAARYAATPVKWTQFWLYVASGSVAGMLAVIYTIRKGANPEEHAGLELEAVACVVVGGTLITGGRGGIARTLLGIAVVASLDMGLKLLSGSVSFFTAEARLMVIGSLLILIAVGNQWVADDDERRVLQ